MTMAHTYKIEEYPNLLEQIKLSSAEIKAQVETYPLTFSQERNKTVEWGIRLPMFVDAFYDFVLKFGKVPGQQEAFRYYLDFNKDFFDNLNRPDLESGIMARSYRTYPSLVRDIYFNKFIEERLGGKCRVIYNTRLDIEEGIDLMICTSKGNYGICFFTQTQRGFVGRRKKQYRHTLFENVEYVEMPMAFKGSVQAGDFFLYGEKEYNGLYNILSN